MPKKTSKTTPKTTPKARQQGFWDDAYVSAKKRAKEFGFKLFKVVVVQSPKRNPRPGPPLYYGAPSIPKGIQKDIDAGRLRVLKEMKV